jgi:hypothetical protein
MFLSFSAANLEGVGRTRLMQFSIFLLESKRRISCVPAPMSIARIFIHPSLGFEGSRIQGFEDALVYF